MAADCMTEILIVDDSATNRSILERLVRGIERGAIVRTFASPEEALLAVRAGDPDLIVTDFSMLPCVALPTHCPSGPRRRSRTFP